MRKFSPQESGSKIISSGHAHAIAAMHLTILYGRHHPANWIDRESIYREKLASPFDSGKILSTKVSRYTVQLKLKKCLFSAFKKHQHLSTRSSTSAFFKEPSSTYGSAYKSACPNDSPPPPCSTSASVFSSVHLEVFSP